MSFLFCSSPLAEPTKSSCWCWKSFLINDFLSLQQLRELAMMMDSFLFDLFELYKNSKRDFILRRLAESSLCLWALSFDLFQQWYDEILKREKKWSMNDINRMWWWAVAQWPGYGSQLCLVIGKSELAYTREMSVKAENAKLPKRLLSSSYWSSLWAIFKPTELPPENPRFCPFIFVMIFSH